MPDPVKVLYCAIPPLAWAWDNGGSIVCREHLQRLSAIDGSDLHVCTIGPKQWSPAAREIVKNFSAEYHPIEFPADNQDLNPPFWLLGRRWPFIFEKLALDKAQTDDDFAGLLARVEPDIVVVDYLLTALFVPSLFKSSARIITITMNPEAQLFGQSRRQNRIDAQSSNSMIAEARFKHFEREVYKRSDAVVAFAAGDLPRNMKTGAIAVCIEPALNEQVECWQPTENNHLFFVGNVAHYPNYLAVQWLAEEFAPELRKSTPERCRSR